MVLTPEKMERIAGMFVRGYPLDLISEWGVHDGWTRDEAKSVVEARGWSLDWSGRLARRYVERANTKAPAALSMGEAEVERMLAVGTDHEVVDIRRLAAKAQQACDALRRALVLQEEKDAEEVARRRALAAQRAAELADPSRINHGTWGGYLTHKVNNVPLTTGCGCQEACDAYQADASVKRSQRSGKPLSASVA